MEKPNRIDLFGRVGKYRFQVFQCLLGLAALDEHDGTGIEQTGLRAGEFDRTIDQVKGFVGILVVLEGEQHGQIVQRDDVVRIAAMIFR